MKSQKINNNRYVKLINKDMDPKTLDLLSKCYCDIYNETGILEWGESWSKNKAAELINKMIAHASDREFVGSILSTSVQDVAVADVIGFCLAVSIRSNEYLCQDDMPQQISPESRRQALKFLQEYVPNGERILFVRELGIKKEHRCGTDQIAHLVKIVLDAAELDSGRFFFWTSEETYLYFLIVGTGANIVYTFGDERRHVIAEYSLSQIRTVFYMEEKKIKECLAVELDKLGLSKKQSR